MLKDRLDVEFLSSVVVRIEGPSSIIEQIQATFAEFASVPRRPPDYAFVVDQRRLGGYRFLTEVGMAEAVGADEIVQLLEDEVEIYVGRRATQFAFVHAGVVSHNDRVWILPGGSGDGKTTLTLALVAAGFQLLSDEYAVIDERGMVHPWRRPVRVKDGGTTHRIAASHLSPSTGMKLVPPAGLVHTKFVPGGRWAPDVQTRGYAYGQLLRHCLGARPYNPRKAHALERATECLDYVLVGPRGDVTPVVETLLELTDSSSTRLE